MEGRTLPMEINKVQGFNPEEYATIIEKEGETCKYLEVKYRKLWFLLKYPNGIIVVRQIRCTSSMQIRCA